MGSPWCGGVTEDIVEGDPEGAGDLEGHLEGRRVAALLDGDDRLPRDADLLGELGLGHLAVREPQAANLVGDARGLAHRSEAPAVGDELGDGADDRPTG